MRSYVRASSRATLSSLRGKLAFLCGLGAKNEEQESKAAPKMALVSFLARSRSKISYLGLFFAPKLNGNACYGGYTLSRVVLAYFHSSCNNVRRLSHNTVNKACF